MPDETECPRCGHTMRLGCVRCALNRADAKARDTYPTAGETTQRATVRSL